jgi:hypothetical protein
VGRSGLSSAWQSTFLFHELRGGHLVHDPHDEPTMATIRDDSAVVDGHRKIDEVLLGNLDSRASEFIEQHAGDLVPVVVEFTSNWMGWD